MGDHFTPVVTNPAAKIFNPYPPITPVHAEGSRQIEKGPGVSGPDLGEVGAYFPGGDLIPGGGVTQLVREPEAIAQPPRVEKRPVKISEGVLQAQLISRVEPRYPALALQTKTEGVVRLRAIISRDGRITALDILSGHPLLVKAALEAVSQWRYRPTMLNGEPVEVETSITVIFQLRN
jgi:protein TonB